MSIKMNFRVITKNNGAESKKVPLKIDLRAVGTHEFHPTACELTKNFWAISGVKIWQDCPDHF